MAGRPGRRGIRGRLLFVLCATAASHCGGRSALKIFDAGPEDAGAPCEKDQDCAGFDDRCQPTACREGTCVIVFTKDCDDHEACTTDSCDPSTGACHNDWVTLDQDGDGFRAPLPGKRPGEPGSCGTDCDDTHASAHPQAVEICDGTDNDCDGVIDNGRGFGAPTSDAQLIQANASPGGLASNGAEYLAAFSVRDEHTDAVSTATVDPSGKVLSQSPVTLTLAGANGGPILWIGDRYGVAWSDRRDSPGNNLEYEIYFNLLAPGGAKLAPDLRVTNARGFSGYPVLAWTGGEFIVAWDDDRATDATRARPPGSPGASAGSGGSSSSRTFHVFGQRISVDGALIGDNVMLSPDTPGGDGSPSMVAGHDELGITWGRNDGEHERIFFALIGFDLQPKAGPIELTTSTSEGRYPTVAFNGSRYVVAWYYGASNPNQRLFAASIDEGGNVVVPTRAIGDGTVFPRTPSLLGLGDRLFLTWADARDDNRGYELYSQVLDANLDSAGPPQRLTFAPGDSTGPIASFGPNGDVGILFSDDRRATHDTYFLRLPCTAGR